MKFNVNLKPHKEDKFSMKAMAEAIVGYGEAFVKTEGAFLSLTELDEIESAIRALTAIKGCSLRRELAYLKRDEVIENRKKQLEELVGDNA